MSERFGPEFFKANRERLTKLFAGTAPIVLAANGELQQNADETYKFRQDSSFWYFSGLNIPDAILAFDKGKEYIILSEFHDIRAKFDGTLSKKEIIKKSGVRDVVDNKTGWKRLGARIKKVKHVATLAASPAYVPYYGFYANPARADLIAKMKTSNADLKLLDIRQHIAQLRSIKQPEELDALEEAMKITENSIKKVMKTGWKKYGSEYEIETELIRQFRSQNAEVGFIIVASGINACTIHHSPDKQALAKTGTLVLDVGAIVDGYYADITRTFYLGGSTKRFKQVYQAIYDVHQYALSKLKPGVIVNDYEEQVEHFIGEKLRELGLIKTVTKEQIKKYFNHKTSHFLGLDAHDIGDYDKPLKPNMVITVEPGIYIAKENIGIRIEDDVLITEDGIKVLTTGLPITLG